MILIMIGICIALVIAGIFVAENWSLEGLGITMVAIGILGGIISLIVTIALIFEVIMAPGIKDEITLYETENAKIGTIVAETVEAYQQYEGDTFNEISERNIMSAVVVYPELKSNTLVAEQIKIYNDNNNKIKELKSDLIYANISKWWLYFGG